MKYYSVWWRDPRLLHPWQRCTSKVTLDAIGNPDEICSSVKAFPVMTEVGEMEVKTITAGLTTNPFCSSLHFHHVQLPIALGVSHYTSIQVFIDFKSNESLFWHFVKLFEKQVFIALSSKEQNVKAGSHCNFMIFQWEPDLTFFKWSKNWKNGHSKQAPVAKNAEKCPQNGPNSSFNVWKWYLRIYPW